MKKYIVSAAVVAAFIAYTVYLKMGTENNALSFANNTTVSLNNNIPTTEPITPTASLSSQPPKSPKPTVAAKSTPTGLYRDGQYIGPSTDAFYGNVQVEVVVKNGRLSDVVFLDYPKDRSTSQEINTQAMPALKAEAIQAQTAQVDAVSGATETSLAFVKSLSQALARARA